MLVIPCEKGRSNIIVGEEMNRKVQRKKMKALREKRIFHYSQNQLLTTPTVTITYKRE
jgi:hypothetical protein